MKQFSTVLMFILSTIISISLSAKEDAAKTKGKSSFAQHNFEFQVTPSADYHIWQEGNVVEDKPYEYTYPFIGFGFGAQYLYRPVEVFGISTGLAIKMQGSYFRERFYPHFNAPSYIRTRANQHIGYISVPIYFHLYKPMKDCTFEFAIGPDFNFPTFSRSATTVFDSNGEKVSTTKDHAKADADEMREMASFGLSMFLGGELNLCEHANLFIGPQIQFLNLAYFNKDVMDANKNSGNFIDASLGLKLGFRFH
ncbi:MAG: hypothetical protein U0T74_11230 [Chitinophagales bacterium]